MTKDVENELIKALGSKEIYETGIESSAERLLLMACAMAAVKEYEDERKGEENGNSNNT